MRTIFIAAIGIAAAYYIYRGSTVKTVISGDGWTKTTINGVESTVTGSSSFASAKPNPTATAANPREQVHEAVKAAAGAPVPIMVDSKSPSSVLEHIAKRALKHAEVRTRDGKKFHKK
jgi:hypothetical protein